MKVAIVGSRDFDDYSQLHYVIDRIRLMYSVDGFVSGGAKGADSFAKIYADSCKIPIRVIKPDWKKHGRSAGFIRNGEIIKAADMVLAFWDGRSRGTKDSIDKALKAKKPCFVFFSLHKKQSDDPLHRTHKANWEGVVGFAKKDSNCPQGLSGQKDPNSFMLSQDLSDKLLNKKKLGAGMQGEIQNSQDSEKQV